MDDLEFATRPEDFLATVGQYRALAESDAWLDIKHVLDERLDIYRTDLESAELEGVIKIQSRISELRYFLALPERTIELLEVIDAERTDSDSNSE